MLEISFCVIGARVSGLEYRKVLPRLVWYYHNPQILPGLKPVPNRALTTVTITRKGQTTIPKDLREKYELSQGTRLQVFDTGDGVMFRKAQSTVDLIGSSKKSFDEMKRRLDEIRREDA